TAKVIKRFYEIGVYPDWWKLEPMKSDAAWRNACDAIAQNDPYCRGIVVLGLDAPEAELVESFEVAARFNMVKGFAVGRTIFIDVARDWLQGTIADDQAVTAMAQKYRALCDTWDAARKKSGGVA
ncbi:MAG: DUF2090 domain-containing protein, partial [Thalassospira sp.]